MSEKERKKEIAFASDSQKPDEQTNEAVNKAAKLMEKWKSRLSPDNLRLGERYLKGDIEVRVHFRFVACDDPSDFCAVFQKRNSILTRTRNHPVVNLDKDARYAESAHGEREDGLTGSEPSNQQEAVLVDVVKLMKRPEVVIPSQVRLCRVDEAYRACVHSLYHSRRISYVSGLWRRF